MKLEPGERSILASFHDGPNAERAADELKQAGFETVQMDRVGGFGDAPGPDRQWVGLGSAGSQVRNILMDPEGLGNESARVLLGAMPESSGMAGAPVNLVPPFLVTVVTRAERVDEAVEILKRHGARV